MLQVNHNDLLSIGTIIAIRGSLDMGKSRRNQGVCGNVA